MAARRKDRVWIIAGVLASVVVIALSWVFFINPQLGDKSAAEQQTADAQVQNIALQQRINKLRQDSQNSAALQAQLDQAHDALPTAHDLDEFTRQLTAQAAKSGVTVVSITPASPVQVQGQTAPAPTTADAGTGTEDNATTTTAPAAPTSTGPAGQLYAIQVTLITDGTVAKQQALLKLVQTEGPRAALVLSSKLAPDQATAESVAPATTPPATTAPASSTKAAASGTKAVTSTTGSAPSGAPQEIIDTWTMTTVLQVFVSPVSPQDEAALQTVAASK